MLRSGETDAKPVVNDVSLPRVENGGRFSVTVPARPEAVRIVRSVMRTWAAGVGFVLDEIEELCLAVDEAFAGLIGTSPPANQVTVRVQNDDDGVHIVAVRDVAAELWPPVGPQTALVRRVLTTLIDDLRFEETDQGPAIYMTKRTSPDPNRAARA